MVGLLPDISEQGNAAKSPFLQLRKMGEGYSSQCYYLLINETIVPCFGKLRWREGRGIISLGYAREDWTQKEVVAPALVAGHLFQGVAGATDLPLIVLGW